jgi:hypothetical protein
MDTASVRDVAILEEDTPADIVEMLGQLRFHKGLKTIKLDSGVRDFLVAIVTDRYTKPRRHMTQGVQRTHLPKSN